MIMDEPFKPKILIEVRPRLGQAGELGDLGTKPSPKFEALTDRLDELAATLELLSAGLGERLESLQQKTQKSGFAIDEIGLKLNLDLESGMGVVIARAIASVGLEASLTWKRRDR
jgi:hypothetical protein